MIPSVTLPSSFLFNASGTGSIDNAFLMSNDTFFDSNRDFLLSKQKAYVPGAFGLKSKENVKASLSTSYL